MSIIKIEGIGPVYAEKLRAANIRSVRTLLKEGSTKAGRKRLAETTGIDETLILKWVNMADLFRINGVASEYSELLEKAGVDSVRELRQRVPANLLEKIKEVQASSPKVKAVPSLKKLEAFIQQAKTLAPVITY